MAILKRFDMTLLNSPPTAVNVQIEVKTEYVETDEKQVQLYPQMPLPLMQGHVEYVVPATPIPPYTPRFGDSPSSISSFDTPASAMPATPLPGYVPHFDSPAPSFAETCASSSASEDIDPPPKLHMYDFRQIRGIGAGGFGSVHLTEYIPTRAEVALKVIDKKYAREETTFKEQKVLQALGTQGSKKVLEFLGSFHDPKHYFFVTAYYRGGDLNTELASWDGKMPLALAKHRIAELVACTKFIHDKGFIHRDLKLENALINDEGGLLIADFGLADCVALPGETFVPGSKDHKYLTGACGTLEYIAPEMLEENSYAFSVDVWSIGVCAFKLLMGETPWAASSDPTYAEIYGHLMNENLDDWLKGRKIDKETRDFFEATFERDPSRRLTLEELSKLPFFANTSVEKMMNDEDVPVPAVGAPPFIGDDGTDEVFFGSFGGGGVYLATEDPSPSFSYISPTLLAPEDDINDPLDVTPAPEAAQMPQPLDSFEDIPLDEDFEEKAETDSTSSPPMPFGSAISVTTTVTVVEEDEVSSDVSSKVEVRQQVAIAIEKPSFFGRVKSWLGKVASAIGRLLPFAKCH